MKIGLLFGSFNPIHIGHLIIGNYMAEFGDLEQVGYVVSPQNPLKEDQTLAEDKYRLRMVQMAIEGDDRLFASDIEFGMPRPSYTIDTLELLGSTHPEHQFVLIIGGDNLMNFRKWKAYEKILDNYSIFVYHRPGYELGPLARHPHVRIFNSPLLDISASFIRKCIHQDKSVRYMVPEPVFQFLKENRVYSKSL